MLGAGGVGKSYLINKVAEEFEKEGVILSASTGVASVNINGQTIHNLLSLNRDVDIVYDARLFNDKILIIDEISMIDGATFDTILKRINRINEKRENNNLLLIIAGDTMQLPPVNSIIWILL